VRSRPRGVTVVELTVALVVGAIVMVAAYEAIHVLLRSEKSSDKVSTRTLAEARLMEMLLMDLRSSLSVTETGEQEYTIERYAFQGGKVGIQNVTWRVVDDQRVVREADGESSQEFDFTGLLDPRSPAFRFRLERVPDATFVP
jgi:prepilin-type N-terminal cleavage/methylation domain-containing protein